MRDITYGLEEQIVFDIEDFIIELIPPILNTQNSNYNIKIYLINEISNEAIIDGIPATNNTFILKSNLLKSIKKGVYLLDIEYVDKSSNIKYLDRTRIYLKR
jgi:hypothetical protein